MYYGEINCYVGVVCGVGHILMFIDAGVVGCQNRSVG